MNTIIESDEKLSKLPKWAQERIANSERRCHDAEQKLKDYLDSQSPSLVFTRSGLQEKNFIQDDRVSFQLKLGEITIALKDDVLECHGNYSGYGQLFIRPWASNVAHIHIIESKP